MTLMKAEAHALRLALSNRREIIATNSDLKQALSVVRLATDEEVALVAAGEELPSGVVLK